MYQAIAVASSAVILSFALVACDRASELTWKEDVRLQDGRVITVSRRSEFKAPHEIGQRPGESHMWLEFEHPITKEVVRFDSKLRGDSEEMVAAGAKADGDPSLMHRPYALMARQSDLYVVTWLDANIDHFFGCPDPPFLLYRWQQGRWERRPLEEIPYRRFAPNLTVDVESERQKIEASGRHLKAGEIVFSEVGYGPVEFDFTGMTQQTFDLPPKCASCTVTVKLGQRADAPVAGPFCTRQQRDWTSRKRLAN